MEPKRVEELFVRTAPILRLRVNGRDIATTAEHPFYALGKGWTNAEELVCQDQLLDVDGRWHLVQDVVNTNELTTVYNFRVQDYHTYFVGCDEWGFSVWAHNQCMPETLERLADRIGATVKASERARIADLVNQRVSQSVLQAELQAHAGIWEAGALRQLTPGEMTTLLGHIDRGVYLHPTIPNHRFADPGLAEFVNQLHEALPIPAGRRSAIVDVNVEFPSQPGRGRTGPAGEADVILDNAVIQYKDGMRTARQIHDQYQASLRMFDPVETTTPIPAREIYFYIPVPGSTRGHRMVNAINHALATPAYPGGARTNVFSRINELVEFVQ